MGLSTIIVGGSVGGIRTAQALRSGHYPGEVIVLDSESEPPYDKPPLSKGFLDGTLGLERLRLISEKEAEASGIELRMGAKAIGLDLERRLVILESGQEVAYDNLVIATGVRARPSPWDAAGGICLLRTLNDALTLKERISQARKLVIVGAGFIGAEVASTARKLGLEVHIVDPLAIPIGRILGDDVGERFVGLHLKNGVSTYFGVGVEEIDPMQGGYAVRLSDSSELLADVVVVGIGTIPNVEWLADSGLILENGLVCDDHCRAVGQKNVYGVGDIARWHDTRSGALVRLEHWTNAVEQAGYVARTILGAPELERYMAVQYIWSDQYDWKLQIAGDTATGNLVTLVEDPVFAGRFAAVYVDSSGLFSGVATVNWPRAMIQCRRLLEVQRSGSEPIKLLQQMVVE